MKLSNKLCLAAAGYIAIIFSVQLFVKPWLDPSIPRVDEDLYFWLPSLVLIAMLLGSSALFGVFYYEPDLRLKRFLLGILLLGAGPLHVVFVFVSILSIFHLEVFSLEVFYFNGNCAGWLFGTGRCNFNKFLFSLGGISLITVPALGWSLIVMGFWGFLAAITRLTRLLNIDGSR